MIIGAEVDGKVGLNLFSKLKVGCGKMSIGHLYYFLSDKCGIYLRLT